MSEWEEEGEAAPRPKRGLPTWFWWTCGAGCLLVIVMVGVITIFGVAFARKVSDPEHGKAQLVDVLPADTWPEGYVARGGGFAGFGTYMVEWPRGMAKITKMTGRGDIEDLLDPKSAANFTNKEFEQGELELQGRKVPFVRFQDFMGNYYIRADISGNAPPNAVLEILHPEQQGPPDEELLVAFLEPFDIWRGE